MSVISTIAQSIGNTITSAIWNTMRDDLLALEKTLPPIGSVIMWAGDGGALPDGYLLCDGSSLLRAGTYADLYAELGSGFGAVDGTHFNLPDLRNKFVIGAGGTYSRNAQGGNATIDISHTHSTPNHSHTLPNHTHGAGSYLAEIDFATNGIYYNIVSSVSWTSDLLNDNPATDASSTSSRTQGVNISGTSSSGGSGNTGDHSGTTGGAGSATQNILPPYVGLFYIIKAVAP